MTAQGCTKADGWLSPHAYEYDPAEVQASMDGNDGYDEYERCGAEASDPLHLKAAADEAWTRECAAPAHDPDPWTVPLRPSADKYDSLPILDPTVLSSRIDEAHWEALRIENAIRAGWCTSNVTGNHEYESDPSRCEARICGLPRESEWHYDSPTRKRWHYADGSPMLDVHAEGDVR